MADARILAEIPSFITAGGNLDLPAVTAAVHRLINEGYDALIVGGTAGEYENLTLAEQRELICTALEAADGKATVIAGAFELGTAKAVERIREHAAWGCHHHLCIPAHYFGFSDPGELQLHFHGDKEGNEINYHILKTTYFEADPSAVTGLNVDALGVLFNPDSAKKCKEMKIKDWDAALYEFDEISYLCWTDTPEASYVLEYNPNVVPDEEIIKMAESAEVPEDK